MKRSRIITCKINGQDIAAREDETILELARQNGIPIPTLCYLEGVTPWGGCRLCMVEIKAETGSWSCNGHKGVFFRGSVWPDSLIF